MIFSMIHSVDGGVGRIGRLFEGLGLFDRFGSTATQQGKSKMKKLLVLAALSAMAMGAQAEYAWTFEISGAQAVYSFGASSDVDGYETAQEDWKEYMKPMFFDPAVYEEVFEDGKTTWAGRYETIAGDFSSNKLNKNPQGVFADIDDEGTLSPGFKHEYTVMAILDRDELAPGAHYAVYYGLGEYASGDTIPVNLQLIESGVLMTDGSPTPAPEPTSGLLLLLGVAGLALKRKRA